MSSMRSNRWNWTWAGVALGCLALVFTAAGCRSPRLRPRANPRQPVLRRSLHRRPPRRLSRLSSRTVATGDGGQLAAFGAACSRRPGVGAASCCVAQDVGALENPTRYLLALDIDPSLRSFQGRGRVEYTNQEDIPLDEVYFRLLPNGQKSYGNGSLTVREVQDRWSYCADRAFPAGHGAQSRSAR